MKLDESTELEKQLEQFLIEKKMRKTEERSTIFSCICKFTGHFDLPMLHQRLEEMNFHVSQATLYYTINILVDGGFVIRHQFGGATTLYELRHLAEAHIHLICNTCGVVREYPNKQFTEEVKKMKTPRFTSQYNILYMYGLCSKCKYKLQILNNKKDSRKK